MMLTYLEELEINCPLCGESNIYDGVRATVCVEGTSVAWKTKEGRSALVCQECHDIFFIQAHVDVRVSKEEF